MRWRLLRANLVRDRRTALGQLAEEAASRKVDDATRALDIPHAMRDWALALCRSNPDSFDAFLKATPGPAFAHLAMLRAADWPAPGGRSMIVGPDREDAARAGA